MSINAHVVRSILETHEATDSLRCKHRRRNEHRCTRGGSGAYPSRIQLTRTLDGRSTRLGTIRAQHVDNIRHPEESRFGDLIDSNHDRRAT